MPDSRLSVIHYKFRSVLETKALQFLGVEISVEEVKALIAEKEGLNSESFDLILFDARMARRYNDENELIPRNSTVVLQRTPRFGGPKLPKLRGAEDPHLEGNRRGTEAAQMPEVDFSQMSEEQRLEHVKRVSRDMWQPAGYKRRRTGGRCGPPEHYICNRCRGTGHWTNDCTLPRRTTGIPNRELMPTTREDPHAMINEYGRYVKPVMHHLAREEGKKKPREPLPEIEKSMRRP